MTKIDKKKFVPKKDELITIICIRVCSKRFAHNFFLYDASFKKYKGFKLIALSSYWAKVT